MKKTMLAAASVSLMIAGSVNAELVTNGGFEDPVSAGELKLTIANDIGALTGWTMIDTDADGGVIAVYTQSHGFWGAVPTSGAGAILYPPQIDAVVGFC